MLSPVELGSSAGGETSSTAAEFLRNAEALSLALV